MPVCVGVPASVSTAKVIPTGSALAWAIVYGPVPPDAVNVVDGRPNRPRPWEARTVRA